jgi:hypothetical protein
MIKFFHVVVAFFVVAGLCVAGFFLFSANKDVAIAPKITAGAASMAANGTIASSSVSPTPSSTSKIITNVSGSDLPPQPQLANPPSVIKGIYLTGWTAGSSVAMQKIINLIKNTELNAVVIDIKDYSGYVSYAMDVPEVAADGAENQIRIARPNTLIKELHDNGIYVIGRITDFQDPILAKAHPEWALKNKTTGAIWTDNNGLAWMDPAATSTWDYFASIAKDAFGRGFDEINFDYIRFASDGALGNIIYPYWNGKTPMATVIAGYFKFLRQNFPNERISADLFGLSTVDNDDLGIGQVIQDAYKYFDYVCPMVYPSHYANGFIGYKNPAAYPYQVISYSLSHGVAKLFAMGNANTTASSAAQTSLAPENIPDTKLRPWLQDFDLGAIYTSAMIRKEKQAVYDTLGIATSNSLESSTSLAASEIGAGTYYGGWLLWNAANDYFTSSTEGALDGK